MKIAFEQGAFADFTVWAEQDRKIHKRIVTLILDIARNPDQGIGKPEPLKHELQGYWSRRITDKHRLVYKVEADTLTVIACKHQTSRTFAFRRSRARENPISLGVTQLLCDAV